MNTFNLLPCPNPNPSPDHKCQILLGKSTSSFYKDCVRNLPGQLTANLTWIIKQLSKKKMFLQFPFQ